MIPVCFGHCTPVAQKKTYTQSIREEEKYERWDEKRKRCTGIGEECQSQKGYTKRQSIKSKTKNKASHDLPR
jgi:hypothetical protein